MQFSKEKFMDQLLGNVLTPAHSINQKAEFIAPKVYAAGTAAVTRSELAPFPHYRDFLETWGLGVVKGQWNIYSVNTLSASSIRTKLYYKWKRNHDDFPDSLETVVSICLACGMDFDYIKDAVQAYCRETLAGKGLRKALIYGAARRFWDFGEIACHENIGQGGVAFGMLEEYYDRFLAERGVLKIPDENDINTSTVKFVAEANDCGDKEEFLRFINKEETKRSFLYDRVELIRIVQDCIDKRRRENESDNRLFARYDIDHIRITYSNFCHGHIPGEAWFLTLACGFGFTADETDRMIHSLHLNNTDKLFDDCVALMKKFQRLDETDAAYRETIDQMCRLTSRHGEPLAECMPSLYRLLADKRGQLS